MLQDVNNSSEVPPDPMNAENDQCNPEESDSLLPGGNSDSTWDSAISVVWEVMPQSRAYQFPTNCSGNTGAGTCCAGYSEGDSSEDMGPTPSL